MGRGLFGRGRFPGLLVMGVEVSEVGLHTGDTRGFSSWALDRARKVNGKRRDLIMLLYAKKHGKTSRQFVNVDGIPPFIIQIY